MSYQYNTLHSGEGQYGSTSHAADKGDTSSSCWSRRRNKLLVLGVLFLVTAAVILSVTWIVVDEKKQEKCQLPEVKDNPRAPTPEHIEIVKVPLPPTAPSSDIGSCTTTINPRGTGCIASSEDLFQSGSFLPDGNHIVATMNFVGAPAAPNPSSIYSGLHVVILKVDGTNFTNGDSWKCVTCGVSASHLNGTGSTAFDYPQTFHDGMRLLAGAIIIDCSPYYLVDDSCTPLNTYMFPIRWSVTADGSGEGGSIRELRLHPNNSYLGFNSISLTGAAPTQFGFIGLITFNLNPTIGSPLVPRYDLTNVTALYDSNPSNQPLSLNPKNTSELLFNSYGISVGEFRGWSKDGQEALWIGLPCESGNFDIMATHLVTGITRRLTRNPGYTDPVDMSPDNNWIVVMDTRYTDRMMFAAGMRGIPPLIDLATSAAVASIRNNGQRRFFQAYLVDRYGDRGTYQGQLLTEGDSSPGGINDPDWNGRADPRWSANGTLVAFYQAQVTSPACGGVNPLPCPNSTEPGGRRVRIFVARLTDRAATPAYTIPPVPQTIAWGTPYTPGIPLPPFSFPLSSGTYILRGNVSGTAVVTLNLTTAVSVAVTYTDYSDDGYFVINGDELAINNQSTAIEIDILWKSNLTLSGCTAGRKFTSPGGYLLKLNLLDPVADSTGTLVTILGNTTYTSPSPFT